MSHILTARSSARKRRLVKVVSPFSRRSVCSQWPASSLPRDVATKESWSYSLSWRGAEALCQQNDRISKYGNVKAVRKRTGGTMEKDTTKWVERWRRGQHLPEYNVAEMVPQFVIASAVYVSPFPRALSLLWLTQIGGL